MNPKIFVGIAIAGLAVILGGILLTGPTITIPSQDNPGTQSNSEVKAIQIELDNIQQIYKDLLHDTSNYRNTRYKHISYLQDYIKSKETK